MVYKLVSQLRQCQYDLLQKLLVLVCHHFHLKRVRSCLMLQRFNEFRNSQQRFDDFDAFREHVSEH